MRLPGWAVNYRLRAVGAVWGPAPLPFAADPGSQGPPALTLVCGGCQVLGARLPHRLSHTVSACKINSVSPSRPSVISVWLGQD